LNNQKQEGWFYYESAIHGPVYRDGRRYYADLNDCGAFTSNEALITDGVFNI